MNKCFLCNDNNYMITKTGATIDIVDGNRLEMDFDSHEPSINIEINYCPICGRKLESKNDKGYRISK